MSRRDSTSSQGNALRALRVTDQGNAVLEAERPFRWNCENIMKCFIVVVVLLMFFYIIFFLGPSTTKTNVQRPSYSASKPTQGPSTPDPHAIPKIVDQLLSSDIIPENYRLKLKVNLPGYGANIPQEKEFTTQGNLVIDLLVQKETNKLELNYYKTTNITRVEMLDHKNAKVGIIDTKLDSFNGKVTFIFKKPLLRGSHYMLLIDYDSVIDNTLFGFYKTVYFEDNDVKKISAVTQMAPLGARRVVPCFDSPEFKATWNVTVVHPRKTTAISNSMEQRKDLRDDDFVETTFAESPKMSSYLLAIFVSDFAHIEGTTKSKITFRVWARPEAINMTSYALKVGIRCLEYFEEYFGIPFPLPKLDMVALPDFVASAMENWGQITFREQALLHDERTTSPSARLRIVVVIAHEIAHQWFGDLVTTKFWDNVWLNEGFANLWEYDGTDAFNSDFGMKDDILSTGYGVAFKEDSSSISHPLTTQISDVLEIETIFDKITYQKGGSVLSMVRSTVGDSVFQAGMQAYLKRHAYANVESADLLESLTTVIPDNVTGPDGNKLNITAFLGSWIYQKGYPFITLTYINESYAELNQQHYSVAEVDDNLKWDIPIRIQQGDNKHFQTLWLPKDSNTVIRVEKKPIIMNADANGFYVINYSVDEWENIFENMIRSNIYSPRTVLIIIRSAFAMSAIGKLPYQSLFKMFKYMDMSRGYLAWKTFLMEYSNHILNGLINTDEGNLAADYLANLLKPTFESIGKKFIEQHFQNDKHYREVDYHLTIYKAYCSVRQEECDKDLEGSEALRNCGPKDQTSKCVNVVAPFREDVYCKIARNGTKEEFERIVQLYENENDQQEEASLREAFSCMNDSAILKRILDRANDPSDYTFRTQDAGRIYAAVASSEPGKQFILDYLEQNFNVISKLETWIVGTIIEHCTKYVNSETQLKQVERIAQKSSVYQSHFKYVLNSAKNRKNWLSKNRETLSKLLNAK